MYDENSFKKQIFWMKAKRVFLLLLFTCIGTGLGIITSSYMIDILLFESYYRNIVIISSAVIFLVIALLLTANTEKDVQDCYWKIACLKKLTLISKKLDNLDNLEKINDLDILINLLENFTDNYEIVDEEEDDDDDVAVEESQEKIDAESSDNIDENKKE